MSVLTEILCRIKTISFFRIRMDLGARSAVRRNLSFVQFTQDLCDTLKGGQSGPEVIELFSCSTQLSVKFHLVIKIKIPTIKTFFMLSSAEHAQLS